MDILAPRLELCSLVHSLLNDYQLNIICGWNEEGMDWFLRSVCVQAHMCMYVLWSSFVIFNLRKAYHVRNQNHLLPFYSILGGFGQNQVSPISCIGYILGTAS